jgi:hypothetical protein
VQVKNENIQNTDACLFFINVKTVKQQSTPGKGTAVCFAATEL